MLDKALRIVVCTGSFLYTFYVLCHLTYFLSRSVEYDENAESDAGDNPSLAALWMLLGNAGLLSVFVLQHSAMASESVKHFYSRLGLEDLERSVYNLSASAAVHWLIIGWQTVPWRAIWNFSGSRSTALWLALAVVHLLGWCIIYSGCIMMDISELAGLKQVYYKLSGRPCPSALKSTKLQRYFMHMRHPSFTGFLIILWIHPLMSIDRLLMASLLTTYMALMWTTDMDDYNYHSLVIARKEIELSNKNY